MSMEAFWPCPECGGTRAFWLGAIKDEEGYLIGNRLKCRACEHEWSDYREEVVEA